MNDTTRCLQLELTFIKLCECGCGQPAPIATMTNIKRGYIKGHPRRFVNGHQTRRPSTPLPDAIWDRVDKSGANGCWLWQGPQDKNGYGRTTVEHVSIRVHRYSYEFHNGPISDDLFVLHKCDTPSCCNPDHLFLGTQKDNVDDMIAKRRGPAPKGENHHMATITASQVLEIRQLLKDGMKRSEIADLLNVSRSTITGIAKGITWKHI